MHFSANPFMAPYLHHCSGAKKYFMMLFVIKNAETEPIITIKVIGQDSNGLNFRVKMSTNMGMLKKSYAERFGFPLSSLKFLFNGHHISDDESPKGCLISECLHFCSNLSLKGAKLFLWASFLLVERNSELVQLSVIEISITVNWIKINQN